ncbi:MAG: alpha-E domain-containing protein [Hyphomonadaceae bacterium]|nr:alpha-E domain-containing protein [Hyphomonadaceae bacterium]
MLSAVFAARENARQVRDQITTEMWERLNRLYFKVREASEADNFGQIAFRFLDDAIGDLHAFKGIVSGTMSHGEGFHFLSLGRTLERAQLLVRLLDLHLGHKDAEVGDYGWVQLLRMCCGLEPYLRVKTADFRREPIVDFLVLNADFPRSLRFCANNIAFHMDAVGALAADQARRNCTRLAGQMAARLNFALLEDVTGRNGKSFIAQVASDCVDISEAIHAAFISYSLAERLPGAVYGAGR